MFGLMPNFRHFFILVLPMIGALNATPASFVTKEVEYRLGESVMIPLETSAPVAETTALELKAQKAGIVDIIRKPEILKDQQMGFARIRTLTPGEVVLKCGDASLRVRVT